MIIKLLSIQIPEFWDSIKYAAIKADGIHEDYKQEYLNELLLALLNDKAQCIIRMNNERHLQALMITRIKYNEVTEKNYLFIQCLYSFTSVQKQDWEKDLEVLIKFAKETGCIDIVFETNNKRVKELAYDIGFRQSFITMRLNVGGV